MTQLINPFEPTKNPIVIKDALNDSYDNIGGSRDSFLSLYTHRGLFKVAVIDKSGNNCLLKLYFENGALELYTALYQDGVLPENCKDVEFVNPFTSDEDPRYIDSIVKFDCHVNILKSRTSEPVFPPSSFEFIKVIAYRSNGVCLFECWNSGSKDNRHSFYIGRLK